MNEKTTGKSTYPRKVAIPYDTIRRWENLVRYARKEGGKIDQ